jgi:hypothetical protein
MRAFVICLERNRAQRCAVSVPSYRDLFDEVVEISAIDAKEMSLPDERIHTFAHGCIVHGINDSSLFIENLPAAACALSHIEGWKRCLESGEPAVIVEDDVHVTRRMRSTLRRAIANIPLDAHIVSLLYAPIGSNPCKRITGDKTWRRLTGPIITGLQMYYLTPDAVRVLLPQVVPVTTPVGKWMGMHIGMSDLKAYQLRKRLYTVWRFLHDEASSTLNHGVSFKRYVPNSNWLYGTVIVVLMALLLTFILRRRRCFASKEDICSAP